jgi:hypothetical protein
MAPMSTNPNCNCAKNCLKFLKVIKFLLEYKMGDHQDFIIGSVPVKFPYEPYEVQKAYMSKVITCLQVLNVPF